jgi:hypothetical protein
LHRLFSPSTDTSNGTTPDRHGGENFFHVPPSPSPSPLLWLSYFNGESWNGDIKMKDETPIAPKTGSSPWCVRVGLELFLLYQSDDNGLYQSVLMPVAL